MKKAIALALVLSALVLACSGKPKPTDPKDPSTWKKGDKFGPCTVAGTSFCGLGSGDDLNCKSGANPPMSNCEKQPAPACALPNCPPAQYPDLYCCK